MAVKKKNISTIEDIFNRYDSAATKVKESIEDFRTEACIRNNCDERDLPDIDRVLIIGHDHDDKYWMFGESAFYWSGSFGQPIKYLNGKLYINPTLHDINTLAQKDILHQFIVVTEI